MKDIMTGQGEHINDKELQTDEIDLLDLRQIEVNVAEVY